MHFLELKQRLRGVIAFTPTPFTTDDRPDLDGLARHIDFVCRSGANAVVVCGGVGEFFSLELDEYRDCMRVAVEATERRVPVLAGIGHSTRSACKLAEYAATIGADGLMINPIYFVEPSEEGMLCHYQELERAAGLGMMVFSTKGAVYTPSMVERLTEVEAVVAFKDEYGDIKMFMEMMERIGDRLAWINGMAETLAVPYCSAGAQGMTSGIVNFAPQLSLAVWEASKAGRWDEARALIAQKIRPLARLRARRNGYSIAVIKEAMNLLGMPGGCTRSPIIPLSSPDRNELREMLVALALHPIAVA
jgi:5-dehydro-4-deoxyglucarate dehydratase